MQSARKVFPYLMIFNRNKFHRIYVTIAIFSMVLASCSKKQAEEMQPVTPDPPAARVTYNNFTAALLQTKCSSCHAAGGSASSFFTFNAYASVVANASRIKQVVLVTKSMPQGGSLTAAELASLNKWFEDGLPEQ